MNGPTPDSGASPAKPLLPPSEKGMIHRERLLSVDRVQNLAVQEFDFSRFHSTQSGLSFSSVLSSRPAATPDLDFEMLRTIVRAVESRFHAREEHSRPLSDEAKREIRKQFFDAITAPGSYVFVLHTQDREFAGFASVLTDRSTMHDLKDLPAEIGVHPNIVRGKKLLIVDEGREFGPYGIAVEKLMYHIFRRFPDSRIVTAVEEENFRARNVFSRIGFQAIGAYTIVQLSDPDGTVINDTREWNVWPPLDAIGRRQYRQRCKELESVERWVLNRLSAAMYFPTSGGEIACVNGSKASVQKDTWVLSQIKPANTLHAVELVPGGAPEFQFTDSGRIFVRTDESFSNYAPGSLDGIFNINVFPTLCAEGLEDNKLLIGELIERQVEALRQNGVLAIRNAIRPDSEDLVHLELSSRSRKSSTDAQSPETLFSRFLEVLQHQGPVKTGYSLDVVGPKPSQIGPDFLQFGVPAPMAAEFQLKVGYPEDIVREAARQYIPLTRDEIEALCMAQGLRLVASRPEHNPWIRAQHLEGQVVRTSATGRPRAPYPTNYIYIGRKVADGQGVRIIPDTSSEPPSAGPEFLELSHHRRIRPGVGNAGDLFSVVSLKFATVDIAPYFRKGADIFFVVQDAPRPITTLRGNSLDQRRTGGYQTEQIAKFVDRSTVMNQDVAMAVYTERGGGNEHTVLHIEQAQTYFTSPGAVNEIVNCFAIEILPDFEEHQYATVESLATRRVVRAIEARELLQACQVGTNGDARIERSIYRVLISQNHPVGIWVGADIELETQAGSDSFDILPAQMALTVKQETTFEETDQDSGFLRSRKVHYLEKDRFGATIGSASLEHVEPDAGTGIGNDTITILPVQRVADEDGTERLLVGIEIRDLPGVQKALENSSYIATLPSFRLPTSVRSIEDGLDFSLEKLEERFGVFQTRQWPLGSKYWPSPGILAEEVYPFLVEVDAASTQNSSLQWVEMNDLLENSDGIVDGHLLTSLFRAAHALGVLTQ